MARLSARQLNRATLARQLLLRRESLGVVEGLRRIVALQAQEPASPYLALWNRLVDFDPAELDRAFADQAIVKGSLIRVTMHAVEASDYPAFHEAMQRTLRGARLTDDRFRIAGLSIEDTDALIPGLRAFMAKPRTSDEVEAWLDGHIGVRPRPGVWWALRHYGPFIHAVTGGPWSFQKRQYLAAIDVSRRPADETEALRVLIRRYLEGFGPASVQDIAQFGHVYTGPIRAALKAMEGELVTLDGPSGKPLLDVPDGALPPEDTPAPPRLLGMWDEILLAYQDRSRVIPPAYRKVVNRLNGDVLPTLLVDGHVAGVWRPVEGGIEATAFAPLADDDWAALAAEARSLVAFLAERDPSVYGRYGHWWAKLDQPKAEVRLLGG